MTERRRLTVTDKLKIVVAQARCPLCGEKLGDLECLEFDHGHALALGGTDTLDNLRAVHIACHRRKSSGTKATSAGSDIHQIAKSRRLTAEHEDFRRRMLTKEPGQPRERKGRIPSRPFPKHKPAERREP